VDFAETIRSRQIISFTYDGHPRIVEPAAFGRHASTGNLVLRGYQVGGSSSSRPVPLWDLFLVDKIGSPAVTGETFAEDPPKYKRDDAHINPILAQL